MSHRFVGEPVRKSLLLTMLLFTSLIMPLEAVDESTVTKEMVFGGQTWRVKASVGPIAPGPNYWSNSTRSVWMDDQGIHLTVLKRQDIWYSTEIFTRNPLGYGTYLFTVDSDFMNYDPNVVAGFFTWDTQPVEANRELDIEFASWGIEGNMKGQYVVQPFSSPDRLKLFDPNMQGTYSTHRIIWQSDKLQFTSWHGIVDPLQEHAADNLMADWVFDGEIPSEGRARFRINLWLFQGRPPAGDTNHHLVIKSFSFVPWQ